MLECDSVGAFLSLIRLSQDEFLISTEGMRWLS